MEAKEKVRARAKRHRRVRKRISGTADRPRLAVYRSNKHIYAQMVDDVEGKTLVAASSTGGGDGDRLGQAKAVGQDLAKKAKDAGISRAVFDRGGFRYHGRVKALAEAAREGGLEL
jgi:large subunit ribosomal protein L18